MPDDDSGQFQRRTFLKSASAAGMLAAASGITTATPGRRPGPKENEVLLGISAGHDMAATAKAAVPGKAQVAHENDTLRYVAVRFPEAAAKGMGNFIEAAQKRPGVKYAEVNSTFETQLNPNDPNYGQQYAPGMVNAPTAWDTTQGSSGVTLAIVDTGAQYSHPDLSGNYDSNPGQDFVDSDNDPAPDAPNSEYHGTHVSGIVGAGTDNGTGVAGISDCTLINGRCLDEGGSGSSADIADAIQWAADQGAAAVNLSLGGGGFNQTMKNAVSYAVSNGCLPICAAGNSGTGSVSYPARYSECMAVTALDESGNLASYSQYGPNADITAPGSNVYSTSTQTRGGYESLSGTSMATPVVTGIAGLIESQWGDLTPSELRNHLKGTAVDVGLSSDEQGCGRVDAANAVGTDPANRSSNCGAGGGGDDPPEDPPGGSCGDTSSSGSVTDYLSSSSDYDCWSWSWDTGSPCEVVVELDGPGFADFDLYVSDGSSYCPSPWYYDYRSISPNSQEQVTISNPDTSTDLQIDVESYSGSGSYSLTITEYGT